MKTFAAVLREMGRAAPYRESRPLSIEEIDLDPPGEGEVVVEVAAAGLCHSDLSVIDGSRPRPLPMVLGHEAAGVVRETGAGVRHLSAGDHVVFSFLPMCGRCVACASGRPVVCENGARANAAGTLLSGSRRFHARGSSVHHHLGVSAFSRYTVAAQESLVKIDPTLPLQTAAIFGCAVLTGVGAVIHTAKVTPGSSVAVFGLGGVGLACILGARLAGAHPIVAIDMLPAKLELGRQLGATHAVQAGTPETVAAIKDLTGGGAAFAFEAAGSARVVIEAYEATGRGGTTVTVGLPHPEQRFAVPAVSLVAEERTVKGSYMGSSIPRRDLPRYIELFRAGRLPVDRLVTRTLKLEDVNEGFDALASGQAVRQILVIGE